MQVLPQRFDFNLEVPIGEDIYTSYLGKELVLKHVYRYYGPVTMQYLPYGGVQSLFDGQLIIHTKSGFIATRNVIYDHNLMTTEEFITLFPDIMNEVLS